MKYFIFITIILTFLILGCDNGTTTDEQINNLIGYWRSENTFVSQYINGSSYYLIKFEQNRLYEFSISSEYIGLISVCL